MTQISLMDPASLPLTGSELIPVVQAGLNRNVAANAFNLTGTTNLSTLLGPDSVVIQSDNGADATIPAATDTEAGVFTAANFLKLDGIDAGATANQPDAYLLDRANHTGQQTLLTISDSGTAAARDVGTGPNEVVALDAGSKLPAVDGSQLINLPPTPSAPVDLNGQPQPDGYFISDARGGDPATINGVSDNNAGLMLPAAKAKLDGIAAGATANSTDEALRQRSTHTGTQSSATISDFAAASREQTKLQLVEGDGITLTASGTGSTQTLRIDGPTGIGTGTVTQVDGGAGLTGSVTTSGALDIGQGAGILVGADSISVNLAYLDGFYADGTVTSVGGGFGLTGVVTDAGVLNVGAGTGITVNVDDVAIDRTTVDQWYAPRLISDLPALP